MDKPLPKTLTAYHTAIPVYIPLKQVSTTHTKRLPTLTKRGGPPLPQYAYRLAYSNFNIFTTKTGKHDAYQTLTDAHHEALPPPPPKNAYRFPYTIFNWKSVYLQPKLVNTTVTMVSTMLTKRHCTDPTPLPKTLTAYETYETPKMTQYHHPPPLKRFPPNNTAFVPLTMVSTTLCMR